MNALASLFKLAHKFEHPITSACVGAVIICAIAYGLSGSASVIDTNFVGHTSLGIVWLVLGVWVAAWTAFQHRDLAYYDTQRGWRFMVVTAVYLPIWVICCLIAIVCWPSESTEAAMWAVRLPAFIVECVVAFFNF